MGLTYDYDSIMHYARNTFSKGTYLDTIQPIDVPGRKRPEIGQRVRLSEGDIAQTNLLYKCPSMSFPLLEKSPLLLKMLNIFKFQNCIKKLRITTKLFTECGRTYQANSATFSSPNYLIQKASEDGERCEWRITATHGERIILNITDLDIAKSSDCRSDYLEIRDGYWHKSTLLKKFCASTRVIEPIISTGSRMLINLIMKNANGHRGFAASYEGELQLEVGNE